MASKIVEVADNLVTLLNAETWSQRAEAVRLWSVSYDLQDLAKDIRITVIAAAEEHNLIARLPLWDRNVVLSLAVQKRHGGTGAAPLLQVDPLDVFAEEVIEFISVTKVSCTGFAAKAIKIQRETVALDAHLRERRCYTTTANITFHLGKT